MPLRNYGVLKARPIDRKLGQGSKPHYQILVVDQDTEYRLAVNVKSQLSPSELLYLMEDRYSHPLLSELERFDTGYTSLESKPNTVALDYVRGNLFNRKELVALPHNVPGPDNDLNEKIDYYVSRGIGDGSAMVYCFGERWGPENNRRDKYFGFLPGNGVHDIHMNQGNVGRFVGDDGVWQDGGLFLHFPDQDRWVSLFLAFQSQSFHTDDNTGHAITTGGKKGHGGERVDGNIRIVAATVNPSGHDPGMETVTLINTTPQPVDLSGWKIADKNKNKQLLAEVQLGPGDAAKIALDGKSTQLSNKGGIISLLDPNGIKIHGVSYTKKQAQKSGWTLVF